jgi:predicted transcriptional regulator
VSKTLKIALQLTDELERAITELASASGVSVAHLTEDALKHYVDWRAEQLHDLQAATTAADQGDFASADEVKALFTRYGA